MRNLQLMHSLSVGNLDELIGTQAICVDMNVKTIYCASTKGIYGLDATTNKIIHQVSLVDAGYCSSDGSVSIIALDHLFDQMSVCLTTSSGDVILWNTVTNELECVGSVDSGLTAASWSTDQEILVLATGQNTLILMTRDFDPITEIPLFSGEFGEAQFVNVGWGKKATQFHGSEGKEAAKKTSEAVEPALSWDDKRPRICWHGDGQYFVVSAIHPDTGNRKLCVWSREGVLHSTSEDVNGVEQSLGWKSNGNLITTSQCKPNKHDMVFFERNGLRHGEFTLPFGVDEVKVCEVLWNLESNLLAVWLEDRPKPDKHDISSYVQLWSVGNYHWYLKQSLKFCAKTGGRVASLCWDQESAFRLHVVCVGGSYQQYTWSWTSNHSQGIDGSDFSSVAVIDGNRVLLTPFRQMVVPPPMSAFSLSLPVAVSQVSFCPPPTSNDLAVMLSDGRVAFFSYNMSEDCANQAKCESVSIGACGGNGFMSKCLLPVCQGIYSLPEEVLSNNFCPSLLHHLTWVTPETVLLAASKPAATTSTLMTLKINKETQTFDLVSECMLEGFLYNTAISAETGSVALQLTDGTILRYNKDSEFAEPWLTESGEELSYSQWKLCSQMDITVIGGEEVIVGLTDRYQLYVNNTEVATNCTSYAIHEDFLLLTTYAHTCRCISKDTKVTALPSLSDGKAHPFDESVRRVERGSKVVCVTPQDTKLILQMPRGNLETIHPRALVLSAVRKSLDRIQFKEAFILMRKHRINMNLLYDHNPQSFLQNISTFISQVDSPGLINQFLTDLQEENVTETMYTAAYGQRTMGESGKCVKTNKVDTICDGVREALLEADHEKYRLSILTAFVRKTTPELDKALQMIKDLKGSASAEEALKYLLFLVDVNELYDVALGMYDFDLVLMVAEKSQKDPKEYIPFLNSLRQMEENYQHYTIDRHLKRYGSALTHIVQCGESHFNECLALVKEQRLYREALQLYDTKTALYKSIAVEYADFLREKKHNEEAGLVLAKAEQWEAATEAFEAALSWRLAVCMAYKAGYQGNKMETLCRRLAVSLKEQNQHMEAACLYEHHLNDEEEAIATLIEGSQWEESLRLMYKLNRLDFIDTHFRAALEESYGSLVALLSSVYADFERHKTRLSVVREQKEKARLEFLDGGEKNLADADLFSDTSSATGESAISGQSGSQMSSGSQKSSLFSKRTGRSAKNRRKQERKKWSLKEGSPHEDIALVEALSKICKQSEDWKTDVSSLLRMLLMFDHQQKAETLQDQFERLLALIQDSLSEIWPEEAEDQDSTAFLALGPDMTANTIAQAVQQGRRPVADVKIDSSLRVPPALSKDNKWKLHSSSTLTSSQKR